MHNMEPEVVIELTDEVVVPLRRKQSNLDSVHMNTQPQTQLSAAQTLPMTEKGTVNSSIDLKSADLRKSTFQAALEVVKIEQDIKK